MKVLEGALLALLAVGSALAQVPPTQWAGGLAADPGATFSEEILVQLFSLKVRALDHFGAPLPDLRPEDFEVEVGGQEVPVVAVDWVPAGSERIVERDESSGSFEVKEQPRLVVLFVQSSAVPHRAVGLRWMLRRIERVLDSLQPMDRVAVVSFQYHLELRSDLTRDRAQIMTALEDAVLFRPSWPVLASEGPSLAAGFDSERALRAGFVENGLEVTADALEPLPGEKILFFLGWGLGEEHGGDVTRHYRSAVAALHRADVTVSSLAVGNLVYGVSSTLDASIERISGDTGGSYVKLYPFFDLAAERLSHSLDGHYRLTFEVPDSSVGGRVVVTLREGPYRVHHSPVVLRVGAEDLEPL